MLGPGCDPRDGAAQSSIYILSGEFSELQRDHRTRFPVRCVRQQHRSGSTGAGQCLAAAPASRRDRDHGDIRLDHRGLSHGVFGHGRCGGRYAVERTCRQRHAESLLQWTVNAIPDDSECRRVGRGHVYAGQLGIGDWNLYLVGWVGKDVRATAKSGETITAWVTGLGPVSGPDNVVPSTFPNFPGVEVYVGTQAANVIYAGRSGCCVALDQISFEVPAGVTGCYVPVAVRTGDTFSNFVSIPISSGGGACSDTAPTVPIGIMNQASAGQPVNAAAFAAGGVPVLRGLGFDVKLYLADILSKLLRVKVSQEDVAKLLRAGQTHNQRALTRAMMKYAAAWQALSPAAKAAVRAALNSNQEGAVAVFGQFSSPATLAAALGGLFPSQGTCTTLPSVPLGSSATGLDAGSSLALSGSAGSWTLAPTRLGQYQVLFGSTPAGPNLPPGAYSITGSGGRDLSAFSATLNVGGNIAWTNKAAVTAINRSQPLTVTWSGGTNPGYVVVGGYVNSNTRGIVGFVCTENSSKGSFTIPSFILSMLPPAATGGGMFVSPHPLSRQVTIPGVDLAYFMDGSNDSKSVVYQ
jgi:hypothetical protein